MLKHSNRCYNTDLAYMSTPVSALETSEIGLPPPAYRLPASARVGRVRLAISELERSVAFYRDVIGLTVLDYDAANHMARLGVSVSGTVLLELLEVPGVKPILKRSRLGLYHTAFLLPSREALSSFVLHLSGLGVPFGSGDHSVSEALYLTDPDGLTVEVYADRDRATWIIRDREIVSGTENVNFSDLLKVPREGWQGVPVGTVIGHVHLYVADLQHASEFYHAALGMDIVTWSYSGALFLSAGGYHHHVALNVWAAGSPVASQMDSRLLFWELLLPTEEERERVAASLIAAGYSTDNQAGTTTFSDQWRITVALSVDSFNSHPTS